MWTETAGPERGRHRTRLLSLGKEKRALEREGGFFFAAAKPKRRRSPPALVVRRRADGRGRGAWGAETSRERCRRRVRGPGALYSGYLIVPAAGGRAGWGYKCRPSGG